MRILQLKFLVLTGMLALTACNGGEDFDDPIPGPTQGSGGGSNFNPDDNCAPRIVGTFVHDGTMKNLGYRCDGFYGTTGDVGLDFEQAAHYFVCPRTAESVEFFVGGRQQRLSLGTARFRDTAAFDQVCHEDTYDADGPYVFSVADLFDAPARIDIFDSSLENDMKVTSRSRNISALLIGLDMNPTSDVTEISSLANSLITEGHSNFVNVDIAQDFAGFRSEAETFLNEIDQAAADASMTESQTGTLPATTAEADAALQDGMNSTAAGVYLFPVFVSQNLGGESALWWYVTDYALATANGETVDVNVAIWDALFRDIPGSAYPDSENFPEKYDEHLAGARVTENFLPMVVVDRNGRVRGGGPFETVTMDPLAFNCDLDADDEGGRYPIYLALQDGANLQTDLEFESFLFNPIPGAESGTPSLTLEGRFLNGVAYHGVKRDTSESISDYKKDYPSDSAHAFEDATDSARLTGSMCNISVNRQMVIGLHRSVVVTPNLDEAFMQNHFDTPDEFTLTYLARSTPEGNIDTEVAQVPITIHDDGSVFTDLTGDGNTSYDPSTGAVPADEHVIGMVSSVFEADAGDPNSADGVTLLVYNFASPEAAEGTPGYLALPRYGAHFTARLEPGDDSETACREHIFPLPGADGVVDRTASPYWHDPYAVARAYRESPIPLTRDAKYEILRQEAYGFVSAQRTGCM